MNKTELVDAIAKQANLTKADAAKALEAFLEVVSETLQKKDKVKAPAKPRAPAKKK